MLDRHKIRNWAYLLLRGQETIAEREGGKGTLRGAGITKLHLGYFGFGSGLNDFAHFINDFKKAQKFGKC